MPEKSPALAPRYSCAPDPVGLVVGTHAVEEALDVEPLKQAPVEPRAHRAAPGLRPRTARRRRDWRRRGAPRCMSASAARWKARMPRVFSSMNRNSSGQRGEAFAHAPRPRSCGSRGARWRSAAPSRARRRRAAPARTPRRTASAPRARDWSVRAGAAPPRYMPTLPSTPKALSNPSPVLPSCQSASTCTAALVAQLRLDGFPDARRRCARSPARSRGSRALCSSATKGRGSSDRRRRLWHSVATRRGSLSGACGSAQRAAGGCTARKGRP